MKNENEFPYVVESCVLNGEWAFPSHTHGLTEVGWPEFFIDPLAFGGEGNCKLINAIWRHLNKPENRSKLDAVLEGAVIRITESELHPREIIKAPYTYCLREVPRSFEGVKLAYPYEAYDLGIPMRFVQIWVEGDDFALMDEYYVGGVTW